MNSSKREKDLIVQDGVLSSRRYMEVQITLTSKELCDMGTMTPPMSLSIPKLKGISDCV